MSSPPIYIYISAEFIFMIFEESSFLMEEIFDWT